MRQPAASSRALLAGGVAWHQGPYQFDGNYELDGFGIGRSYKVYAEPLDGAVAPSEVTNAMVTLCRNSTPDPGWPPAQGCVVPPVAIEFSVNILP
jgi:hypothetical protein